MGTKKQTGKDLLSGIFEKMLTQTADNSKKITLTKALFITKQSFIKTDRSQIQTKKEQADSSLFNFVQNKEKATKQIPTKGNVIAIVSKTDSEPTYKIKQKEVSSVTSEKTPFKKENTVTEKTKHGELSLKSETANNQPVDQTETKQEKGEVKKDERMEKKENKNKINDIFPLKTESKDKTSKEKDKNEVSSTQTSTDFATQFSLLFLPSEKNPLNLNQTKGTFPTEKSILIDKVDILKNKKDSTKENTATKVKDEKTIQSLNNVLKAVNQKDKGEEKVTGIEEKKEKEGEIETKEEPIKSFHLPIQDANQTSQTNNDTTIAISDLKSELPKEIQNLVNFNVVTPKKIIVTMDQKLGGVEIQLEKQKDSILVQVKVEDEKTRQQLQSVLTDLRDNMNTKGIDMKFQMNDEGRKEEKRKEDGLFKENGQNRGQQNQEGRNGYRRN